MDSERKKLLKRNHQTTFFLKFAKKLVSHLTEKRLIKSKLLIVIENVQREMGEK